MPGRPSARRLQGGPRRAGRLPPRTHALQPARPAGILCLNMCTCTITKRGEDGTTVPNAQTGLHGLSSSLRWPGGSCFPPPLTEEYGPGYHGTLMKNAYNSAFPCRQLHCSSFSYGLHHGAHPHCLDLSTLLTAWPPQEGTTCTHSAWGSPSPARPLQGGPSLPTAPCLPHLWALSFPTPATHTLGWLSEPSHLGLPGISITPGRRRHSAYGGRQAPPTPPATANLQRLCLGWAKGPFAGMAARHWHRSLHLKEGLFATCHRTAATVHAGRMALFTTWRKHQTSGRVLHTLMLPLGSS